MPEPAVIDAQIMDAFTQAFQQANDEGSATVGFRNGSIDEASGQSTETGYDVTITRVDGGTPAVLPKPNVGRIVHYVITEVDAKAINKRRQDFDAFRRSVPTTPTPAPGMPGATGHMAHVGNHAYAGDVYPAIIVRVWDEPTITVNARVLLDGTDTLWVTSRPEGDQPGQWTWPPRV